MLWFGLSALKFGFQETYENKLVSLFLLIFFFFLQIFSSIWLFSLFIVSMSFFFFFFQVFFCGRHSEYITKMNVILIQLDQNWLLVFSMLQKSFAILFFPARRTSIGVLSHFKCKFSSKTNFFVCSNCGNQSAKVRIYRDLNTNQQFLLIFLCVSRVVQISFKNCPLCLVDWPVPELQVMEFYEWGKHIFFFFFLNSRSHNLNDCMVLGKRSATNPKAENPKRALDFGFCWKHIKSCGASNARQQWIVHTKQDSVEQL